MNILLMNYLPCEIPHLGCTKPTAKWPLLVSNLAIERRSLPKCHDKSILFEFIDKSIQRGPGKFFRSNVNRDFHQKKALQRFGLDLNVVAAEFIAKKLGRCVSIASCQLYEALIYKFGASNRHQKYWKSTLYIYRHLKMINKSNLFDVLQTMLQRLESCDFNYQPTNSFLSYLGACLMDRIYKLDRVRYLCNHSAELSMGYVEIGHLLTFNLMIIAIASDVANEALKHICEYIKAYNKISKWLRRSSEIFPLIFDETTLHSSHQLGDKLRTRNNSTLVAVGEIQSILEANEDERRNNDNSNFRACL